MKVLSLAGGGFQGLYSALLLEAFEAQRGPLRDHFDAFAGTSVGAITASAAAVGMPMAEVVSLFERMGARIFSDKVASGIRATVRGFAHDLRRSRYDGQTVGDILTIYCEDRRFVDLDRILMVPAVRMRDGAPVIFSPETHPDVRLSDAVRASAAAPMIFPPVRVMGDLHTDGALVANAPDALAIEHLVRECGANIGDISMLSLGAMNMSPPLDEPKNEDMGILGWTAKNRIFRTLISAQAKQTERMAAMLLGPRYARVDAEVSPEQHDVIGLDVATPQAREMIRKAAQDSTREFMAKAASVLGTSPIND